MSKNKKAPQIDINKIYTKKFHNKNGRGRRFVYFLQAVGAFPLIALVRLMPLDTASALGGKLGRLIGPCLKEHKVAMMNLGLAFPHKTEQERKKIIMAEWENIGRTIAEFPHISRRIFMDRITVKGVEHLEEMRKLGKGGVAVSIHMGNWELMTLAVQNLNMKVSTVYRSPNNPFVEKIFRLRTSENEGELIPKNKHSLLKMARLVAKGEVVGMLIDQKLNEGVEAEFFGRKAMTTPTPAILSRRYGAPVLMGRILRTEGAYFEFTLFPLTYCKESKNMQNDILDFTQRLNDEVEKWVRDNPEQWLWIHKRWNKDALLNP